MYPDTFEKGDIFERLGNFCERMTQPFERADFLFKRIAQAVRTDANFSERVRNGL